MAHKLPTIQHKGKTCVVDFRLEEMRCGKMAKQVKFVDLKQGKYSPLKKKLRALRFRAYGGGYIPGVDD